MTQLKTAILARLATCPQTSDELAEALSPNINPARLANELLRLSNEGAIIHDRNGTWQAVFERVNVKAPPLANDAAACATNEQNRHILASLRTAQHAATDLVDRGFTVLDVEIGNRNPLLRIQSERRCQHLHGAVKILHGGPGAREITWAARHMGAQIEWRAQA